MTSQELGAMGEHYVARLLTGVGADVEYSGPADLLVGGWPVEVKAARSARYRTDARRGFQFCLHRAGRRGIQSVVVVMLCYWQAGREPVAFVVPSEAIGKRSKIVISSQPWTYNGMWSRYYQAWDVLADVMGELTSPQTAL